MTQKDNDYDMEKDGVDTATRGEPGTTGTGSAGLASGGVSGSGSDGDVGSEGGSPIVNIGGTAESAGANSAVGTKGTDTDPTGVGFVTKDGVNTENAAESANRGNSKSSDEQGGSK